ncbi:uncharacterized protein ISCGN_031791 [Ixodes scapularis]
MATDEATPLDITVVRTLRLPRFWTADPQLWFAQVESQFTTSHITSQTQRFHHVVAALPPETAVDIRDIILEPPTTNPYDNLKAELIKRTSASEHQRLQQLLTSEELGDRTPSQLLRRLQQLLGERAATFDPALLRELFLQRLPNNLIPVQTPVCSKCSSASLFSDRLQVRLFCDTLTGMEKLGKCIFKAISETPLIFPKIRCAKTPKECKQVIANVYASTRTCFPEKSVVKSWRRENDKRDLVAFALNTAPAVALPDSRKCAVAQAQEVVCLCVSATVYGAMCQAALIPQSGYGAYILADSIFRVVKPPTIVAERQLRRPPNLTSRHLGSPAFARKAVHG